MERPQKATALLLSLLGLFLVAHARSRYEAEDVDISLNVDKQPMGDLLQHMERFSVTTSHNFMSEATHILHQKMEHQEVHPAGGSMSTSTTPDLDITVGSKTPFTAGF